MNSPNVLDTCIPGAPDCAFIDEFSFATGQTPQCANYNNFYTNPEDQIWLIILGFIVMCVMGFAIGANDVANAWGTSVGSKAISLKWACIIGSVATWLGAVTLGYGVSDTIQKGVAKVDDPECWACHFCDSQISLYAVGMFGALIGAAMFLFLATFTYMPVSTTHSIVGAVVGMTIYGVGGHCLNWKFNGGLGGIFASWIISPVLSGVMGCLLYWATNYFIFKTSQPRKNAMISLPILYGAVALVMIFLILVKSGPTKKMDMGIIYIISICTGIGVAIIVQLFVVPYVRLRLPSKEDEKDLEKITHDRKSISPCLELVEPEVIKTPIEIAKKDVLALDYETSNEITRASLALIAEENELSVEEKDAMFVFKYLLVLVAALESFAFGANDTANATAALSAMYSIHDEGLDACKSMETPSWILSIAGASIIVGICVYGYRVIQTIGMHISFINMQRGFCMEFSSTITVVIATILKIPVSTTHCQVGSVVFVSLAAFGPEKVKWSLFGKIILSWVLTIPAAGLVAAFFTYVFKYTILN